MIFMNRGAGPFRYHAAAMTLRLQINLIVGALTALFVLGLLVQQLDDDRQSVNEEVTAAHRVALQMLNRAVWASSSQGPQALLAYLRGMGRVRSNEITVYDGQGALQYRSPPSAYKPGRDAPAWFERLVAPRIPVQSIALPGGRLEVRADPSRAALDAWDDFVVLAAFAAGLLVAANAMVFWLVGRAVRPFGRIVEALNALEGGRFDVTLPAVRGTEAAAIGVAFNRMVGVLQQNIESERRAAQAERRLSDSRRLAHWIDGQLEQERRSIARELHDELGQSVTAIRSMALSIAQRVGAVDAESERAARLIAEESSRLYDAMHGLIPRLTPMVLDNLGLEEALRDLVERTCRSQPGVTVELKTALAGKPAGAPGGAPPSAEVALTLYRAAQEGITNALRHGQARSLRVSLESADGGLVLEILDDGRGLAAGWSEQGGHYGLQWLAERVEAVGGRFEIGPRAGGGVRLVVQVPVSEEKEVA
jgi:two-component system sensor histidine kinase UhpB